MLDNFVIFSLQELFLFKITFAQRCTSAGFDVANIQQTFRLGATTKTSHDISTGFYTGALQRIEAAKEKQLKADQSRNGRFVIQPSMHNVDNELYPLEEKVRVRVCMRVWPCF